MGEQFFVLELTKSLFDMDDPDTERFANIQIIIIGNDEKTTLTENPF